MLVGVTVTSWWLLNVPHALSIDASFYHAHRLPVAYRVATFASYSFHSVPLFLPFQALSQTLFCIGHAKIPPSSSKIIYSTSTVYGRKKIKCLCNRRISSVITQFSKTNKQRTVCHSFVRLRNLLVSDKTNKVLANALPKIRWSANIADRHNVVKNEGTFRKLRFSLSLMLRPKGRESFVTY